jgi:hypothetical protein
MNSRYLAIFAAALTLFLAWPAHAADIVEAHHDPASDQIVAQVAYRGTNPDHDFSVQWGECSDASPPRVVGRLIDAQGDDIAREDYRVQTRIGLENIPCRPAIVTLRLGRVSHLDMFVPREIELLSETPQKPYEELGRVEARGVPGEQRSYVYQELCNKARALGADAVIQINERKRADPLPPLDAGDAALMGNAYPGPLRKTEPGAFPQYGFGVQTGGVYYEVSGVAVRYQGSSN